MCHGHLVEQWVCEAHFGDVSGKRWDQGALAGFGGHKPLGRSHACARAVDSTSAHFVRTHWCWPAGGFNEAILGTRTKPGSTEVED
jgi:hypothetical protein